MIADIITVSRILFSLCLLLLSPLSVPFAVLYLLCGVTDVLDGIVARKLHIESEKGAILDSIADLFFAVTCAVKILPILCLPVWIWIWTVLIAAIKVIGILKRGKKERKFFIDHSVANKLTGLLIFLLPLTLRLTEIRYGAAIVCAVATVSAVEELFSPKIDR